MKENPARTVLTENKQKREKRVYVVHVARKSREKKCIAIDYSNTKNNISEVKIMSTKHLKIREVE